MSMDDINVKNKDNDMTSLTLITSDITIILFVQDRNVKIEI